MEQYKQYPKANLIREWDKLLKLSKEDVVKLWEEWQEIKKENEEMSQRLNKEMFERIHEISDFLKSKGIDVYKYRAKGFFKEKSGYQAWYKKNVYDVIYNKYPRFNPSTPYAHCNTFEFDGFKLTNNQSPTNIVELYDRIKNQYEQQKRQSQKTDKLLIKSIEYAAKHNIDIEDLDHKSIIQIVNDVAKENYLKENLPNGEEVYLKHACSECSTYIMGERRCSCGNRRIYIEVEGDIIQGFYHYPEAY